MNAAPDLPEPDAATPPTGIEDAILGDALLQPTAERADYLAQRCGADVALRARLEQRLAEVAAVGGFLQQPLGWQPDARATEQPGQRIGRYTLVEAIGQGGCGTVWLAEQTEPLRRRVALKVIKLGMDTRAVIARFEAERQALAMMDHPNIARVFDAGATAQGRPFFVMELVPGRTITRHCDERSLPIEARLRLCIDVCHAIQHAHQKGIIHRDIKPSNILVGDADPGAPGRPCAKVIDFGIAKATQAPLTEATVLTAVDQFMGTPAYMSPEQAGGRTGEIDTRADVYSLGALLHELLVGRPPFDAQTLQRSGYDEMRRLIREVEPPRLAVQLAALEPAERERIAGQRGMRVEMLAGALAGDLDWIVFKALEKSPERRYESAGALAADLERFLRQEPVVARPPSRAYVLGKLVRRHRLAFGAAAAIAALLVVGTIVTAWLALRATQAEREQSRLRVTAQEAQAAETTQRQRAERQELAARRRAYAADLNLVQQALAQDNLNRAQDLLDRQRPKPGDVDLRGWEWRYLWQFCRNEATWQLPGTARGLGVGVSGDGHWLAIAGRGGSFWDLRTRTPKPLPVPPRGGVFKRAAFPPLQPWWVLRSTDPATPDVDVLTAWNPETMEPAATWAGEVRFLGPTGFSGDGTHYLMMRHDEVQVRRLLTGELVRTLPKLNGAGVALSHDGRLIAIENFDGEMRITDVRSGEERWRAKVAIEHVPLSVFGPDGTFVTCGSGAESTMKLWDGATGKLRGTLPGHRGYVRVVAFSRDGRTMISGSQDQTIRVWDLGKRELKRTLRGHRAPITFVRLLPDDRTVISAAGDGVVLQWDLAGDVAGAAHSELARRVVRWAFAPDSAAVITLGATGEIERWSGAGFAQSELLGRLPNVDLQVQDSRPLLIADPPRVTIPRAGGRVEVWDWATNQLLRTIEARTTVVYTVGFRAGGTKVLLSYEGDPLGPVAPGEAPAWGLHEWDIATGTLTRSWKAFTERSEHVLSPDGRWCLVRPFPTPAGLPIEPPAVVAETGKRRLIDMSTGAERTLEDVAAGEDHAQFSPDGRFLAVPLLASTRVYALPEFKVVAELGGAISGMHGTAFTPDSRRLATISGGVEAVRIWDTESWEPVLTLDSHRTAFIQSGFSPDGNVLGTMSHWSNLNLWRAPSWAEIAAAEAAGAAVTR